MEIHRPTHGRSRCRVGSVRSSQRRNPSNQPESCLRYQPVVNIQIIFNINKKLNLPLLQASHSPPESFSFDLESSNVRRDFRSNLISGIFLIQDTDEDHVDIGTCKWMEWKKTMHQLQWYDGVDKLFMKCKPSCLEWICVLAIVIFVTKIWWEISQIFIIVSTCRLVEA